MDSLEQTYLAARRMGGQAIRRALDARLKSAHQLVARIASRDLASDDPEFSALEDRFFTLAPLVAANPASLTDYMNLSASIRTAVKRQSEHWNMDNRKTRETLYRILYGTRSAVEEVMLQMPANRNIPPLLEGVDEPSATPSASLLGVTVHSGDILVSRGGAPTSALIARGNDFPGNFSHVALAYVDSASGRLSVIESHIERGVVVSTPEEYVQDKKLRVMVLRLRSDLLQMKQDPLLPHRAAQMMFNEVMRRHIPYDFTMDYADSTKLFCSEVASYAYRTCGVRLWMGISYISSQGLRRWLADFGVRQFETQEPSDLEYDPQLRVVAEWRDIETLRKDHTDNAVTEAMLERAETGEPLGYDWRMLPVARVLKAYSWMLNEFGMVGPVPEGMDATAALRNKYYSARHAAAVAKVQHDAEQFFLKNEIAAPYWDLLRMARKALD